MFSSIVVTICSIAKVVLTIVAKINGLLNLSTLLVVVCCVAGFFVPMGMTICFVICKLTGVLSLGWVWILLTLFLDVNVAQSMFSRDN